MTRIYTVWDDGRDAAPDAVKRCMDSWERLNPDAELMVFDNEQMNAALPEMGIEPEALWIAARTNLFRTHMVADHGGVWVDATLLATIPLEYWLPEYLRPTGAFFFSDDSWDRPISSCFIAASEPGHPLLCKLRDEIVTYWDRERTRTPQLGRAASLRRPGPWGEHLKWQSGWRKDRYFPVSPAGRDTRYAPYHWWHYLVGWLDRESPEFYDMRRDMPWIGAGVMHSVQNMRKYLSAEDYARAVPFLLRTCPVQKLDWRVEWPDAVFEPVPPERVAR